MMQKFLNYNLIITSFILLGVIVLFEFSDLDILVSDLFYDFHTNQWLLSKDDAVLKFIFYSGAKKVLIVFALSILILVVFFQNKLLVKQYKRGLLVVLFSAILIPLVVGGLKAVTNTPCPKNIQHYNGSYPDIALFSSYPKGFEQKCKIRCWPAGHASGGFALLSLFFLFKTKKNKKRSIFFALFIGWSMGVYKMLIGDHFLSHTIVTMLIAWIIVLLVDRSLNFVQNYSK